MPTSQTLTHKIHGLTTGQFVLVVAVGLIAALVLWQRAAEADAAEAFKAVMMGVDDSVLTKMVSAAGSAPEYVRVIERIGALAAAGATGLVAFSWLGRSKSRSGA